MVLRLTFLNLVVVVTSTRIARRVQRLAPRRPLESDPILSVEEYEVSGFGKSESGGFSHELAVKFIDEAHLRGDGTQSVTSTTNHGCAAEVSTAAAFLGAKLVPLFQDVGEELEELARRAEQMSGVQQPDMRGVVTVHLAVEDAEHLVSAAKQFDALPCVEYVSIDRAELPPPPEQRNSTILQKCHRELPSDGSIPDFTYAQGYLRPGQLDADYLHSLGADGSGIMYADCEIGINFNHVEFANSRITPEPGFTPTCMDIGGCDHGTASVGITLGGDGFGIKGLANKADGYFFSVMPDGMWVNQVRAIAAAISKARAGDVVLIEQQTFWGGPVESGPNIWNLVRMGSDAGVVIVAAAGNSERNLDGWWYAPYRARGDSGAIIVGAGTPSHAKLSFSTYGSRVDVQAWGESVMTSGYGLCTGFPGHDVPDSGYTPNFGGTSSASAIVGGAVTLLQSWALLELGAPLTPTVLRDILRSTGHPQSDSEGHIGSHPNLRAAVEVARGNPMPTLQPTPAMSSATADSRLPRV